MRGCVLRCAGLKCMWSHTCFLRRDRCVEVTTFRKTPHVFSHILPPNFADHLVCLHPVHPEYRVHSCWSSLTEVPLTHAVSLHRNLRQRNRPSHLASHRRELCNCLKVTGAEEKAQDLHRMELPISLSITFHPRMDPWSSPAHPDSIKKRFKNCSAP